MGRSLLGDEEEGTTLAFQMEEQNRQRPGGENEQCGWSRANQENGVLSGAKGARAGRPSL